MRRAVMASGFDASGNLDVDPADLRDYGFDGGIRVRTNRWGANA